MQESTANEFYERIVEGTDYEKKITLKLDSGHTLEGVEIYPVNKQNLADVIQSLPSDMFDAVEEADSAEEAEKMLEEEDADTASLDAMSSETVDAFEKICKDSLDHEDLTTSQMNRIVEELDFSLLFDIGGQVIDMSFSEGGAIKDFQEQQ